MPVLEGRCSSQVDLPNCQIDRPSRICQALCHLPGRWGNWGKGVLEQDKTGSGGRRRAKGGVGLQRGEALNIHSSVPFCYFRGCGAIRKVSAEKNNCSGQYQSPPKHCLSKECCPNHFSIPVARAKLVKVAKSPDSSCFCLLFA